MAYYRNRETGLTQAHPKSGLGEFFNSDEIGQDGKPVKPFVPLPITSDRIRRASHLMRDNSPDATTGSGSVETQEGDQ